MLFVKSCAASVFLCFSSLLVASELPSQKNNEKGPSELSTDSNIEIKDRSSSFDLLSYRRKKDTKKISVWCERRMKGHEFAKWCERRSKAVELRKRSLSEGDAK
jgi:hypothetical protein